MLLDPILLAVRRITSLRQSDASLAILPQMRIAVGDGIRVINPFAQRRTWLTGNVDYAVLRYLDVLDNKGMFSKFPYCSALTSMTERLLRRDNSRDDVFHVSVDRLFLVEAKKLGVSPQLGFYMPQAVGQALGTAKITGYVLLRL